MSVAVGFKNSTGGEYATAVNAIKSAREGAAFIGIDKQGNSAIYRTTGNDCGHLILRGGDHGPNYYEEDVEAAASLMEKLALHPSIMIDCIHANTAGSVSAATGHRAVVERGWGRRYQWLHARSNLVAVASRSRRIRRNWCTISVTDGCIVWEIHRSLRKARRRFATAGRIVGSG
jgi:3-deoxy-7-phosphoheptulonate synthase